MIFMSCVVIATAIVMAQATETFGPGKRVIPPFERYIAIGRQRMVVNQNDDTAAAAMGDRQNLNHSASHRNLNAPLKDYDQSASSHLHVHRAVLHPTNRLIDVDMWPDDPSRSPGPRPQCRVAAGVEAPIAMPLPSASRPWSIQCAPFRSATTGTQRDSRSCALMWAAESLVNDGAPLERLLVESQERAAQPHPHIVFVSSRRLRLQARRQDGELETAVSDPTPLMHSAQTHTLRSLRRDRKDGDRPPVNGTRSCFSGAWPLEAPATLYYVELRPVHLVDVFEHLSFELHIPPRAPVRDRADAQQHGVRTQTQETRRRGLHKLSLKDRFFNGLDRVENIANHVADQASEIGDRIGDAASSAYNNFRSAFPSGTTDANVNLDLVDYTVNGENANKLSFEGFNIVAGANVKVAGTAHVTFGLRLSVTIDSFTLTAVSAVAYGDATIAGLVEIEGEAGVSSPEIDLGKYTLGTVDFQIGPVPVIVTPTLSFKAGAEVTISTYRTSARVRGQASGSVQLGFSYSNGAFTPISSRSFSYDGHVPEEDDPEQATEVEATAFVQATLIAVTEFIGGPTVSVKAGIKGKVEVKDDEESGKRCVEGTLDAFVQLAIGAAISLSFSEDPPKAKWSTVVAATSTNILEYKPPCHTTTTATSPPFTATPPPNLQVGDRWGRCTEPEYEQYCSGCVFGWQSGGNFQEGICGWASSPKLCGAPVDQQPCICQCQFPCPQQFSCVITNPPSTDEEPPPPTPTTTTSSTTTTTSTTSKTDTQTATPSTVTATPTPTGTPTHTPTVPLTTATTTTTTVTNEPMIRVASFASSRRRGTAGRARRMWSVEEATESAFGCGTQLDGLVFAPLNTSSLEMSCLGTCDPGENGGIPLVLCAFSAAIANVTVSVAVGRYDVTAGVWPVDSSTGVTLSLQATLYPTPSGIGPVTNATLQQENLTQWQPPVGLSITAQPASNALNPAIAVVTVLIDSNASRANVSLAHQFAASFGNGSVPLLVEAMPKGANAAALSAPTSLFGPAPRTTSGQSRQWAGANLAALMYPRGFPVFMVVVPNETVTDTVTNTSSRTTTATGTSGGASTSLQSTTAPPSSTSPTSAITDFPSFVTTPLSTSPPTTVTGTDTSHAHRESSTSLATTATETSLAGQNSSTPAPADVGAAAAEGGPNRTLVVGSIVGVVTVVVVGAVCGGLAVLYFSRRKRLPLRDEQEGVPMTASTVAQEEMAAVVGSRA